MANSISFFLNLNDSGLLDKVDFSAGDFTASYVEGGKFSSLDIKCSEGRANSLEITDKNINWDISIHGIELRREISLKNTFVLFGESGLASDDAVLGVATICISDASNRKEVFKMGSFTSKDQSFNADCLISLSDGKYRSNMSLKTVLYLVSGGKGGPQFPKQSGTILGEFDRFDLLLFENKTLFPVYEVDSPNKELWWVDCKWSNINEDPFTQEYVAIVFNRSNKHYSKVFLADDNPDFNPSFLVEIMCTAVQIIIEKVKESSDEWGRLISNASYPEGTIAYMIQYMRMTFDWDFSSPELLAKTIRRDLYGRMIWK